MNTQVLTAGVHSSVPTTESLQEKEKEKEVKKEEEEKVTLEDLAEAVRETHILKEQIRAMQRQNEARMVAFSASLSAGGRVDVGPTANQITLVFKRVITNLGNAYNPATGVFTAPLRGLYRFDWHIGVHGEFTGGASLVRNTERIFTAFERQLSHWAAASHGANLVLEAGDSVFVRLHPNTRVTDDGDHVTSFSGHLLYVM